MIFFQDGGLSLGDFLSHLSCAHLTILDFGYPFDAEDALQLPRMDVYVSLRLEATTFAFQSLDVGTQHFVFYQEIRKHARKWKTTFVGLSGSFTTSSFAKRSRHSTKVLSYLIYDSKLVHETFF